MSEMIERVARAIDEASDEISLAFMNPQPLSTNTIEKCRVADREKRMRQARAAIEAMREPTKEMLNAATYPIIYNSRGEGVDRRPNSVWDRMIDIALGGAK